LSDFYCDELLSGRTPVRKVVETENVVAFHHTRPSWPAHVVVTPRRHVDSLLSLEDTDQPLLLEMLDVIRQVAAVVVADHGGCHVVTNLGDYQDSKHLHWHVYGGERIPTAT
jgi:histidine triad (HIT) family protein